MTVKDVSRLFDLTPAEVIRRLKKKDPQIKRTNWCGSCGQAKKSEVNK